MESPCLKVTTIWLSATLKVSARSLCQIEQGRKDLLDEQLVGEGSGARRPVVGGGYDGDQLLAREHVNLVTAGTIHREAFEVAAAGMERLQPPEVAVLCVLAGVGVGAHGPRNPVGGQHATAVPGAPVQVELTELQQVATAQTQAAAGHGH